MIAWFAAWSDTGPTKMEAIAGGQQSAAPGSPARAAILPDVAIAITLMLAGLTLRVRWWGGFGLSDDPIFWGDIRSILEAGIVMPNNQGYRFPWWLPTAALAQAFGLTETTMVLPILAYSILGIGLLYVLGRVLWGRWGGAVAAAFVAVHPMDVTWSTLITNDFAASFFSVLTVLCTLRALAADDRASRQRNWIAAGTALLLTYHSKVTGLLLAPVVALIAWGRRDQVRDFNRFLVTVVILFGASALVSYAFSGTVFGPIRIELTSANILDPATAAQRQVTRDAMKIFPEMLLSRNYLGDWLNAFYPHALILLVLLAWPLGLRVNPALWGWFAIVFLGMEFNVQRVAGYWVTGFRNVRHAHIFVYPLVLLLTGYLVALRAKRPALATAAVVVLLATATVIAVSAATKMHTAFADGRAACRLLESAPPSTVYLDDWIRDRCLNTASEAVRRWKIVSLPPDSLQRRNILARALSGYVVTGGGREPIYNGVNMVPLAIEVPPDRVELVLERGGPIDARWRPEPFRIWKLREAPVETKGAGW